MHIFDLQDNLLALKIPKKSKSNRFRGTAKQLLPTQQQAASSASPAEPNVVNQTDSISECIPTASERKLGTSLISEQECMNEMDYATHRTTGFRLIDLQCLSEAMSMLHMCKDGK